MFQKIGEKRIPPKIITDYQSANAGVVAEATYPAICQIVADTPTRVRLTAPGKANVNVSFEF